MTRQRIEAFLERQVDALNSRDVELLLRLMRPPLPVFHPKGGKYTITEADVRSLAQATFDTLKKVGAKRVSARLLDLSKRTGTGTVSCLIEVQYLGATGELLRTTRVRHFLEMDDEDIRIVMVEYLHAGFDEILGKFRRPI